jgi:hypothetical protein
MASSRSRRANGARIVRWRRPATTPRCPDVRTAAGKVHYVVGVGQRNTADGCVVGMSGFYIDVTDSIRSDIDRSITENVSAFIESRTVIEQAKGALMVIYGISADRAFDVLTWKSQRFNVTRGGRGTSRSSPDRPRPPLRRAWNVRSHPPRPER